MVRVVLMVSLFAVLTIPLSTHAATKTPQCTLSVTGGENVLEIINKNEVVVREKTPIILSWSSANAGKVLNEKGKTVTSTGTQVYTPVKVTTYRYTAIQGSKKSFCSVTLRPVSGSITTRTLLPGTQKPVVTGKALGTKTVIVKLYTEGSTKAVYTSSSASVKSGVWNAKFSKKIATGTYAAIAYGDKRVNEPVLGTSTLVVGKKGKSTDNTQTTSKSTIAVELVPLLVGGIAQSGTSVPLSYLQVTNIGKEAATLKGFELTQNGSARAESIIGLTVSDDGSGVYAPLGGKEGDVVFKNNVAALGIDTTLAPGQMRLFTIRGMVSKDLSAHTGTQLKIDVSGILSDAAVQGKFPIRGTTWNL